MDIAGVSVAWWGGFFAIVVSLLVLDLGVFHRKNKEMQMREALLWTGFWVVLSMIFGACIFAFWGVIHPASELAAKDAGFAFLAGYVTENALSIDNIFVFLVVFSYFKVPAIYQHRVLFWGIFGAMFFRALFIALGATILEQFAWSVLIFGGFLIFTGVKMLRSHDEEMDVEKNPVLKVVSKIMPVTKEFHGEHFFTKIDGKLFATPLLVCLVVVEFTDIVFAVDSIPATFGITRDPFLVFTSNVCAILGLRAMFFAVAGLMKIFHYLGTGLAFVLMFVGFKMLYEYAHDIELVKGLPGIPLYVSLLVIVGVLGFSIFWSIKRPLVEGDSG